MARSLPETPLLTVDVIVEIPQRGIVLIERKNPPAGWAIPGGFVDRGEDCEAAARRELKEETGLEVEGLKLFGVYSEPDRDPRFHTCSVVYRGVGRGEPVAADDAARVGLFERTEMPETIAFDHRRILGDYLFARESEAGGLRNHSYGIVIVDETREPRHYLLVKKRRKPIWELPKGRAEAGETPEEAARREVLEEVGIGGLSLVPAIQATGFYERSLDRGHKHVTFFVARVEERPPVTLSHEHADWGWYPFAEAREMIFRDTLRQVLETMEQFLDGASRCR